ncbi:hypothetical protein MTR_3g041640 [Medicago truncatula]|uniref:DUF4283 domain protein n=1 Tax=Medicago truncatula TaxID=3880 RepID=G7IZQ7_MEDTR|nr:hypothetical protein MTR_3g041640 [Medicago truncatula]
MNTTDIWVQVDQLPFGFMDVLVGVEVGCHIGRMVRFDEDNNYPLIGNLSKVVAFASISNFVIIKKLNVTLHPPKASKIIEVIWRPPIPQWVKCNIDRSSTNQSSACGCIFRNHDSNFLLCFGENTRVGNALHVELSGTMRAIKLAKQ